jgi:hypothetical protein
VLFINKEFPQLNEQTPSDRQSLKLSQDHCASLAALVHLIGALPSQLLPTAPDEYSELTIGSASIRSFVTRLESMDFNQISSTGGQLTLQPVRSRAGWSPISLIRRALENCPDSVPAPQTSDFPFISDPALRAALRLDLSEVNEAIRNRSYKSATVLAGSLVEALLLWAIEQRPAADVSTALGNLKAARRIGRNIDPDPKRWHITEYTEVALELGLILRGTAEQCRLAKDFRNLIHPGRAQRTGQACNRATALSATAAVEHVTVDLS